MLHFSLLSIKNIFNEVIFVYMQKISFTLKRFPHKYLGPNPDVSHFSLQHIFNFIYLFDSENFPSKIFGIQF